MADVLFLAIALGFFVLAALYVRWCDRIVGPDRLSTLDADLLTPAVAEVTS